MTIAFRVDASLDIGSGHVMRCLTLAAALKAKGLSCRFLCRELPGNLIEQIRAQGYPVHRLPFGEPANSGGNPELAHAAWLSASQEQDAAQCANALGQQNTDWLVVDHYALDARWESTLAPGCRKLMVIDDLADRRHQADLLLDQTSGRDPADYTPWLPETCKRLCGGQYALLRPEFAALRDFSLARRKKHQLGHLLISLGGVDKDNATGQVLQALRYSELPAQCRITVVMGTTAPWQGEIRQLAEQMPWPTTLKVGVSDMAQLMADSDLAIGAAGASAWERCCLGLPTLILVLADNQQTGARALTRAGAARLIGTTKDIASQLAPALDVLSPELLATMSRAASNLTDGQGVARVLSAMGGENA